MEAILLAILVLVALLFVLFAIQTWDLACLHRMVGALVADTRRLDNHVTSVWLYMIDIWMRRPGANQFVPAGLPPEEQYAWIREDLEACAREHPMAARLLEEFAAREEEQ